MKVNVKSNRLDSPGKSFTVWELREKVNEGIYKSTDREDSNFRFVVIKDYNANVECVIIVDLTNGRVIPMNDPDWDGKLFYAVNETITVDFSPGEMDTVITVPH